MQEKSAEGSDVLVLPWFSSAHISSHYPNILREENTVVVFLCMLAKSCSLNLVVLREAFIFIFPEI